MLVGRGNGHVMYSELFLLSRSKLESLIAGSPISESADIVLTRYNIGQLPPKAVDKSGDGFDEAEVYGVSGGFEKFH